jgi:hypothetical protein
MLVQRIVNQAQEVGASHTGVRHDVDRRRADAGVREHFNREEVSPRWRPPRLECCPPELELVPNPFNAMVMLVDRHLNFTLQHGFSPEIGFTGRGVDSVLEPCVA